jgi:predicted  nucleic acid-binding Zn-ribbon protein
MGITEKQILEQAKKIRELRSQGVSDEQIMNQMKLSHGAYWRRVKRLKEIDRQILHEKFSSQLPSEIRILEDRLLRTIQNCENIANDQSKDPMARLDAERLKIDCSIIMVRIFREGPYILNIDTLEQRQEKLHR